MVVEGFTGAESDDLDTDDDGTLDVTPWTRIVDGIAVLDDPAGRTYAPLIFDATLDMEGTTPGGASRIPDGVFTNSLADWVRNDPSGAGLPGSGKGTLPLFQLR